MFQVYIIQSVRTVTYYIGSTNNLSRRLQEHTANKTRSLKNKGPFKLIYTEQYSTSLEAKRRERQIKSYKGGNAFKVLINARR